jgi:hypothetical protein
MAKDANRPEERDRYQHEQDLWLQIAEELERRDQALPDGGAPAQP